jgi:hypothetical protein
MTHLSAQHQVQEIVVLSWDMCNYTLLLAMHLIVICYAHFPAIFN